MCAVVVLQNYVKPWKRPCKQLSILILDHWIVILNSTHTYERSTHCYCDMLWHHTPDVTCCNITMWHHRRTKPTRKPGCIWCYRVIEISNTTIKRRLDYIRYSVGMVCRSFTMRNYEVYYEPHENGHQCTVCAPNSSITFAIFMNMALLRLRCDWECFRSGQLSPLQLHMTHPRADAPTQTTLY